MVTLYWWNRVKAAGDGVCFARVTLKWAMGIGYIEEARKERMWHWRIE